MRIEHRDGYRYIIGGPVPAQADAITLGRTVITRSKATGDDVLLAHELVHVRQFIDLGPIRFLTKYIGSYIKGRLDGRGHMDAYRRIPLEIEACWLSRLHDSKTMAPTT